MLILADSQLGSWLMKDRLCKTEIRPWWPISRWVTAVRTGKIRICAHTVVIYLEATCQWEDVPPLKNILQSLCRTIRSQTGDSQSGEPRIFIANHLQQFGGTPVRTPIVISNFTLQQATRSICHAIGRVFELLIYEHFVSCRGRTLKPVQMYFHTNGLSQLGCMIFQECVLREAGLKGYWFGKRPSSQ